MTQLPDNLYENSYTDAKHFSFGKNWQSFLITLNEQKIEEAMKSLTNFLGGKQNIENKTFVDVGCGSGLFSLAAYKLGAKRIVSLDIDDFSIACASHLHKKAGNPRNWEIKKGSALNQDFLASLDVFDIVYSWGVLHHTGDMYNALRNVAKLIAPRGRLFLAIYNDNKILLEGTSNFWLNVKRLYNKSPSIMKILFEIVYICYYTAGLVLHGKNPIGYIKNYQTLRGMNFLVDVRDWLGGYPYEYANSEAIVNFYTQYGLDCIKVASARSIGCNEFLFAKAPISTAA